MAEPFRRAFVGREDGPHLLVTAGVHGDEFEPIVAVKRVAELFDGRSPLVDGFRGRVTLVPVVNEAAFRLGRRTSEDGLDLARVCPGDPDGSVTERAAWAISGLIDQADFYLDLHTGGTELAILPLAGYMLHTDPAVRQTQNRMATAFGLPIVWGTTASLDGRTLSVARDARIPAIYAEYGGSAACDRSGVAAYVDGCLNVMAELGMLARERPPNRVEHFVEDDRPASGHLQVRNPSPLTGVFEPAVRLGDRVRSGDPIGVVFNPFGQETRRVTSDKSGIVIVLRTFPRVRQGDSLCVVLETD